MKPRYNVSSKVNGERGALQEYRKGRHRDVFEWCGNIGMKVFILPIQHPVQIGCCIGRMAIKIIGLLEREQTEYRKGWRKP
jgi:hypothetical protein